jgi:hypothetical protein
MNEDLTIKQMEDLMDELGSQGFKHMEELDTDGMLEALQQEFDFELTNVFDGKPHMFFYEETTADGYSVYIATEDPGNVNIGEDVYYYETDRFDKLKQAMQDGLIIYLDEYEMGDWQITSAIEDLYDEVYQQKLDELIDEARED